MAGPDRRMALSLLACAFALSILVSGGRLRVKDEYEVYWMTQSLVERGELSIPQAVAFHQFYGKHGLDGKPYSPYGPGHAALAAPFYLLGKGFHAILGPVPWTAEETQMAFVTLVSSLFGALATCLFYLVVRKLGAPPSRALMAALAVALTTPLLPYATYLYSEPIQACLFLFAMLGLLRAEEGPADTLWLVSAGSALGLAILVKAPAAIAAPSFVVAAAWLQRDGRARRFALIATPIVAALLLYAHYNHARFGTPLDLGYTNPEGARPVGLTTPSPSALVGLTISPGKGLLVFAPLVLVAAALWPAAIRGRSRNKCVSTEVELMSRWSRSDGGGGSRSEPLSRSDEDPARQQPAECSSYFLTGPQRGRALHAALGTAAVHLFFYIHYTYWEGGYSFGPRFLVPTIPLLLLPLPVCWDDLHAAWRKAAPILAAAGLYVQILGVSTSFLEDQAAGTDLEAWRRNDGNRYYHADFSYRLTYNPLISQSALLSHHAGNLAAGHPLPRRGTGLDFWPLYFAQTARDYGGEPPTGKLLVGFAVPSLLLAAAAVALARLRARDSEPPGSKEDEYRSADEAPQGG